MELLEKIKKVSHSNSNLSIIRLKSARIMFSILALLFFLNYFFIIAKFFPEIFEMTLIYSYILFVVSFFIVLYFYIKNLFFWKNKIIFFILLILLLVLFVFTIIPFIFNISTGGGKINFS